MSTTPLRSQVLRAYKDLLRAQKKTFEADQPQINNARLYTRQQFLERKDEVDPAEVGKLLKTAQQAAVIIRKNIVQGVKKPNDNETYVLKLDEEKEVNSNDTIKMAGKLRQPAQRAGEAPQKCCSS
ncbi:hypothetical protein DFS34DRAFT_627487 [Phlyctochytrium arcticum]|nr:hypothetical protein DFS34DRAFT_627487 [Phlyctochytrium arcticum]